jgi:hypothetical protein
MREAFMLLQSNSGQAGWSKRIFAVGWWAPQPVGSRTKKQDPKMMDGAGTQDLVSRTRLTRARTGHAAYRQQFSLTSANPSRVLKTEIPIALKSHIVIDA